MPTPGLSGTPTSGKPSSPEQRGVESLIIMPQQLTNPGSRADCRDNPLKLYGSLPAPPSLPPASPGCPKYSAAIGGASRF